MPAKLAQVCYICSRRRLVGGGAGQRGHEVRDQTVKCRCKGSFWALRASFMRRALSMAGTCSKRKARTRVHRGHGRFICLGSGWVAHGCDARVLGAILLSVSCARRVFFCRFFSFCSRSDVYWNLDMFESAWIPALRPHQHHHRTCVIQPFYDMYLRSARRQTQPKSLV